MSISFQNKYYTLTVSETAEVLEFADILTKKNYAVCGKPFGILETADHKIINACSAELCGDILTVKYEKGFYTKTKVTENEEYLLFSIIEVANLDYYYVSFADLTVDIDYNNDSSFVACGMGLSTNTKMSEYPGQNIHLAGGVTKNIGIENAAFAIIGVSEDKLNGIMRNVVNSLPFGRLPKSKYSGPFACDCPDADRTYAIRVSPLTLENEDEYIEDLENFGITQVNIHQSQMFRQGDFMLNPEHYKSEDDFKKVIEKLHNHGIAAAVHSYAFFIESYGAYKKTGSKYLCPVPHKDLAVWDTFTLCEDIDGSAESFSVCESLDGFDCNFGFAVLPSPILWIDDELIHIEDVKDGKFCVTRSAFGTASVCHKKGAKVRQLRSYFTHLMPEKNSDLFYEIAKNTADFYNNFDFDAFYIDAIDGSLALDGDDFSWYYATEFVNALFTHLKKPPIFNCCYGPQYPGHYYARTLMGAFDPPGKGYRDFIDVHCDFNNKFAKRMYLVSELGWWRLYPPEHKRQYKLMWEEDVEYLMSKTLATDSAMCWLSSFEEYKNTPILASYIPTIRLYAKLQKERYFDKKTKDMLAAPQSEFHIAEKDGEYCFCPTYTDRQRIESCEDGRNILKYKNKYDAQSPKIRIEALYTAKEYDDESAKTILSLDQNEKIKFGTSYPVCTQTTDKKEALGVWIKGDGKGETVNIRLRSKTTVAPGFYDRFVHVDFTGWRYYSFYEQQNCEENPDSYPVEPLDYHVFEDTFPFYNAYDGVVDLNNLTKIQMKVWPEGDYDIYMKDIVALPHEAQKLLNPTVDINGQKIIFNTLLESEDFLEYDPIKNECIHYDKIGNIKCRPAICGDAPIMQSGDNTVTFTAQTDSKLQTRAALTLRTYGKIIER